MQLLWQTRDGHLLSRGTPQTPPFADGDGASLFDHSYDFDRVDPATGAVVEEFRQRHARLEQDAWYLTGHVVEGDTLFEILFRVQLPEHHGGRERAALGRTAVLTALVPREGRRWVAPDGHHLLEGAPQTTRYGKNPPCELVDGLHDYALVDPVAGAVVRRFHRSDVLIGYGDDEVLTRHRVEEDLRPHRGAPEGREQAQMLVEYRFDYHEDSCWGTSDVRGHERKVLLAGLVAVSEDGR